MLRLLNSMWKTDCGAALIESAIVIPVFLTLVGGVYEFGFFLYQQQLAVSGVRDAARYLTLAVDPTNTLNQNNARNLAVTGSIAGGRPRVPGWTSADVSIVVSTVSNLAGAYNGEQGVQIVTVSTSFIDPSLGFLGLLGLNQPTISVSHQERFVGGPRPG